MLLLVQSVIINSKLQSLSFNLLYNRSITSNTKLLKLGLYRSVSCTRVKRLFKKNWSELFMNHQIDLSCSTPSTIVIGDSIAAGLARFSDVWHNFFRNALNLGIGGDRTEHIIWRVDNLSFPASIKYVIIHCGTNNIKFNNPTDIANGILCVYYLIQSKLPNAQIIVTGLFPRSQKSSYFSQIVNDVNIELGNACSLYQILFFKPNDEWLQENGKLNPQLFWDNDLHLSKTGYQKFATSLSNFISSCNLSKSTSFDLRKIDKSFPPLSRTNIHIPTKEIVHLFKKNTSFVSLSIFINHLCIVYMFVKFLYLYLLLPFVLLVLPFLFQPILVNQF